MKAVNEGVDCVNMGYIEYVIDKFFMGMFFLCICNKVKFNNNRFIINYVLLYFVIYIGNWEFLKGSEN